MDVTNPSQPIELSNMPYNGLKLFLFLFIFFSFFLFITFFPFFLFLLFFLTIFIFKLLI